jgi:hypothetical protein
MSLEAQNRELQMFFEHQSKGIKQRTQKNKE